jgi:hypothetical protein
MLFAKGTSPMVSLSNAFSTSLNPSNASLNRLGTGTQPFDLARAILTETQIGKTGHHIDSIAEHLGAITNQDQGGGGKVLDAVMQMLSTTEKGQLERVLGAGGSAHNARINTNPHAQTEGILKPFVDAASAKIEDIKQTASDVMDAAGKKAQVAKDALTDIATVTSEKVLEVGEIIVTAINGKKVTHDDLALAKISSAVYDKNIIVIAGYRRLDAADLAKFDLKETDLYKPTTGFKAALYEKNGEYILAFAGTDGLKAGNDWKSNFKNEVGRLSDQHKQALDLTEKLATHDGITKLRVTGHSLGGGLASLAGAVHGVNATTFNAAGIRDALLSRYGIDRDDLNANIRAVSHRSDPLRNLQDGPYGSADALGERVSTGTRFAKVLGIGWKHDIDDVINSIEKKLAKDK